MRKKGREALTSAIKDYQAKLADLEFLLQQECAPTVLAFVTALVQNGPRDGLDIYDPVAFALQEKGVNIEVMDVRNIVSSLIALGDLRLTRELQVALPE